MFLSCRFSQFFIAPLAKAETMDREVQAIDSGTNVLNVILHAVSNSVLIYIPYISTLWRCDKSNTTFYRVWAGFAKWCLPPLATAMPYGQTKPSISVILMGYVSVQICWWVARSWSLSSQLLTNFLLLLSAVSNQSIQWASIWFRA